MRVQLNPAEIAVLFRQNSATEKNGGYQQLLVSLQKRLNHRTGEIQLNDKDLERIPKYAYKYGNGGWEDRIVSIFGRSLGTDLGRVAYGL